MKTTLLSIAFSFSLVTGFGQITVGSSDMVSAGDTVRVSYATNTGAVDYTLAGANYLWDFSTLVPNYQELLHFNAPTAIPFNFLSTIAVLNASPDSLPLIGAIPSDFTDYYKNGSSGYRQNGLSFTYSALTTFAIPVIFTASDYVYNFPLNYGDLDTSDAAYSFSIPNLAYIGQTRHRTNNVDGWGTLITPYGTFNTIRVVSILDATDTISIDTLGQGFSIPRPTVIQYKWLATGMNIPVLEVDVNIVLSNPVVTNVEYQDSLRVTLPQVGIAESVSNLTGVEVYPNPASDKCVIFYSSSQLSMVEMKMTDLSGRELVHFDSELTLPGQHSKEILLSGIASGMYLINISSEGTTISRRIVVGY